MFGRSSSSKGRFEGSAASVSSAKESPRGSTPSLPISIRRPASGRTTEAGASADLDFAAAGHAAQSCPAPRAPVIGSLPPPSHSMMMPELSLPPSAPDVAAAPLAAALNAGGLNSDFNDAADLGGGGGGEGLRSVASSCPAVVAHFPDRLQRSRGNSIGRSILGGVREDPAEGSSGPNNGAFSDDDGEVTHSGSVTAISVLQQRVAAEKADLGHSQPGVSLGSADSTEGADAGALGRVPMGRTFSNASAEDAADAMARRANNGSLNSGCGDGLEDDMNKLDMAAGADMFDFELEPEE